ncbi:hypothetical protein CDD83_8951 [Cordyceps sp. RAO-2017]|nr:hypothetical protein CDD83_8951 [Cordyceps sp. RAO-2017]
MASLGSKSAARLWRNASNPRVPFTVGTQRFQSIVAKPSSAVPHAAASNQPDYEIQPDKATSTFTPVPKRIQNGSEDILPAAVVSGAPLELQARTVRIYREAKPATQSGDFRGHHWRMDWDILPKGHRWENQLMGWQSSGDFMQGTHVNFKSKEDAIFFAEKQGYEYFVQEPNSRKFTPKATYQG